MEGSFKIIQGPFSIYKEEFSDKSSTSFSLFSSLFTYQVSVISTIHLSFFRGNDTVSVRGNSVKMFLLM